MCSFPGSTKNKHWENSSCIEAHKAGPELGDVTQRSCDALREEGDMPSPRDTVKFPFYLHECTRGHVTSDLQQPRPSL